MKTKKIKIHPLKRRDSIKGLFFDRTRIEDGLTKEETLMSIYGLEEDNIKSFDQPRINTLWTKIKYDKHFLLINNEMVIISKRTRDEKTILVGKPYGKRRIPKNTFIYWRCKSMKDAEEYKKLLEKTGRGFFDSANMLIQTVKQNLEEEKQEKVIFNTLKRK